MFVANANEELPSLIGTDTEAYLISATLHPVSNKSISNHLSISKKKNI